MIGRYGLARLALMSLALSSCASWASSDARSARPLLAGDWVELRSGHSDNEAFGNYDPGDLTSEELVEIIRQRASEFSEVTNTELSHVPGRIGVVDHFEFLLRSGAKCAVLVEYTVQMDFDGELHDRLVEDSESGEVVVLTVGCDYEPA